HRRLRRCPGVFEERRARDERDERPCRLPDRGTQTITSMPTFEPTLLARVDSGYAAFERTLKDKQPLDVVTQVKDSGLRGRGGAGFPCGLKWTFLPKGHPGPIYMCINADESEPCTFNNRVLMEEDPHQVLEGIILSCYATKATT